MVIVGNAYIFSMILLGLYAVNYVTQIYRKIFAF